MALRVSVHERNVMEAIGLGALARPLYHRRGEVDPNHTSIGYRSRCLKCGLPRATTDVEHVIIPSKLVGAAQDPVQAPQLGVVVHVPIRRGYVAGPSRITARTSATETPGSSPVIHHVAPASA